MYIFYSYTSPHLVDTFPEQLASVSAIAPRRDLEERAVVLFNDGVVADLARAHPPGHVGGDEGPVEELAVLWRSRDGIADGEGTGVSDAVLADESPIRVGLVGGEGKGEVLRTEFWLRGGDCG